MQIAGTSIISALHQNSCPYVDIERTVVAYGGNSFSNNVTFDGREDTVRYSDVNALD